MINKKRIWLSYPINNNIPLYGGRNDNCKIYKTSSIVEGKSANDTRIETTVHMGTHIDMPYHFYEEGQTVNDFEIDFWFFKNPLFVELSPINFIIENELIEVLDQISDNSHDILIIKTGICNHRMEEKYWKENYGFSPEIYKYLVNNFRDLKVIGFDSISISSWQDREVGKISHQAFLNPKNPILILEDMDLTNLNMSVNLSEILISPLRIEKCDGLPCTVYGTITSGVKK